MKKAPVTRRFFHYEQLLQLLGIFAATRHAQT